MKRVCALAVTLVACGDGPSGPPTPTPSSVLGCYTVDFGVWSGSTPGLLPPRTIVLLDSLGTNFLEQNQTLVRAHPPGTPMGFMAWWRRLESNHLTITFSQGEGGVQLNLLWSPVHGNWQGTAQEFTDVTPSLVATTGARLAPRSCA
jgi:hypothetical protein